MEEKRIKLAKQFLDKPRTYDSSYLFNLYNGFVALFDNKALSKIKDLTNIDLKPALDYARNDSDLLSSSPKVLSKDEYDLLEQSLSKIIRDLGQFNQNCWIKLKFL